MVVDAEDASKERKDGPVLCLVNSFEFKPGRVARGVEGNSEMLEEAAAPQQTSDGERVRECGINMQYMLSDEE